MAASFVASAASNDKSPDKTDAPTLVTTLSNTSLNPPEFGPLASLDWSIIIASKFLASPVPPALSEILNVSLSCPLPFTTTLYPAASALPTVSKVLVAIE